MEQLQSYFPNGQTDLPIGLFSDNLFDYSFAEMLEEGLEEENTQENTQQDISYFSKFSIW